MAVNKTQKFTPQEVETIQNLNSSFHQITLEFGQISISKYRLEEREKKAHSTLSSLEKQEKELAASLTKKYGKGSLDIETGEFTPVE
jgi:hypothetical protein